MHTFLNTLQEEGIALLIKVEISPYNRPWRPWRGVEMLGLGGWLTPSPAPLLPGIRAGTHFIRGWVGRRAGQHWCGKSRLPPGFDPWTVQPVASRYTDWAIAAHRLIVISPLALQPPPGVVFYSPLAGFSLIACEVSWSNTTTRHIR